MARDEFASQHAGRRILLAMFSRLGGLTMAAMLIAVIAGFTGEHMAAFAMRVVDAACEAVIVFSASLALVMQRRWRQLAASGVYPRRRSTLLVPLTVSVLTTAFLIVVQPIP